MNSTAQAVETCSAETLHTPLILGRAPNEEIRTRYRNSLTLCDVTGKAESGEGYNVRISEESTRRIVVTCSLYVKLPRRSFETCDKFVWTAPERSAYTNFDKAKAAAQIAINSLRAHTK